MNISGLRRISLVFAVGGSLIGMPSAADAQAPWSFQSRAGVGVPGGDLTDVANVGPSFGAGIARWLSDRIAIRADLDIDLLDGSGEVDDVTLYHYNAGVEIDLLQPQVTRWKLHGDLGLGATTLDSELDRFSGSEFTLNGGLSLGYAVSSRVRLFGGGRLYLMFTDETTWLIPLQGGVRVLLPAR